MKATADLSGYETWLAKEGYQPSTITVSLRHLRGVEDNPEDVGKYRVPHLRRYLRYVRETRRNPMGKSFTDTLRNVYGLEPSKEIEKHGQRVKVTLDPKQWKALRQELMSHKDPINKVLLAYMESPLRISEFLALPMKNLNEETVRNVHLRRWMKRKAQQPGSGVKSVFQILCPTQRCAYSRLRRRLRDVCEYLNLTTDLDTLYKSFHALAEAAAA